MRGETVIITREGVYLGSFGTKPGCCNDIYDSNDTLVGTYCETPWWNVIRPYNICKLWGDALKRTKYWTPKTFLKSLERHEKTKEKD